MASLCRCPKAAENQQRFQVYSLAELRKINEEGVTVLLVEQNIRESLNIADRGYVLEKGKIIIEGTGRELLSNEHVKEVYLGI